MTRICFGLLAGVVLCLCFASAAHALVGGTWVGKRTCTSSSPSLEQVKIKQDIAIAINQIGPFAVYLGIAVGTTPPGAANFKCVLATGTDAKSMLGCAYCGSDDLAAFDQFVLAMSGQASGTKLKLVWAYADTMGISGPNVMTCKLSAKVVSGVAPILADCSTP